MAITTGQADAVWAFAEHEHRDLARGIDRIHDVACEIGHRPTSELSVRVLDILRWLDGTLEPHIAWEEAWLYPEIDARVGTPWATRGARFDHRQIRDMAARLRTDHHLQGGGNAGHLEADVLWHLFWLEALLRAHLEREERYLMPLLDGDRSRLETKGSVPPVRGPD